MKKVKLNEAQLRRLVRGMIAEADQPAPGSWKERWLEKGDAPLDGPDGSESSVPTPVARTRYVDPTLAANVHSPDLDRQIGVMLGMKHFTRDASIEFRDVIMATKDAVKRGESEYADRLAQLIDHGVKAGIVQIKR